jgi:hypothetical protein
MLNLVVRKEAAGHIDTSHSVSTDAPNLNDALPTWQQSCILLTADIKFIVL